jgi:hypothetical protein
MYGVVSHLSLVDPGPNSRRSTWQLIFLPAAITLGVTLLRLIGELAHWSRTWFNPEQGGPWSIVGIVWLVPILGVYFALKLVTADKGPPPGGRAIGLAVLGAAVFALGFYLFQMKIQNLTGLVVMWTLAALAAALQYRAWKPFFDVVLAYGCLARAPVAVVMLIAT